MQFIKVLKYSIIDGADNIENVCNIDIVIKDMLFFQKRKWIVYKIQT